MLALSLWTSDSNGPCLGRPARRDSAQRPYQHSALIMGAGMVAGGLYGCAVDGIEGDHLRVLDTLATGPCMSWPGGLQRFEVYQARVKEFARRGWIDPVKGLEGDRVYLF